jgi:23S rRNA pseudouridine1911/1915/1917 synthase
LYGKNKIEKDLQIPVDRQMLHALKLGFYHPKSNEWMEFLAPLPDDFKTLLITLANLEGQNS